jgi:hypothetical protein
MWSRAEEPADRRAACSTLSRALADPSTELGFRRRTLGRSPASQPDGRDNFCSSARSPARSDATASSSAPAARCSAWRRPAALLAPARRWASCCAPRVVGGPLLRRPDGERPATVVDVDVFCPSVHVRRVVSRRGRRVDAAERGGWMEAQAADLAEGRGAPSICRMQRSARAAQGMAAR